MTQEELNYIKEAFSQIIDDIAGNPDWHEAARAIASDLGTLERELEKKVVPLPSNLDKAAEEYAPDFSNSIASKAAVDKIRETFKAGAMWMARQGVNIHGRVLPGTHGNSYVESDWFDKGYGGLSWNDEVDLIIRKKQ